MFLKCWHRISDIKKSQVQKLGRKWKPDNSKYYRHYFKLEHDVAE